MAVGKVEGVESVEVSLQRGVADVRLRAGNTVTLARLRQIVKSNGFVPQDASVVVSGQIVARGTAPALAVSGTDVVLPIARDAAQPAAFDQVLARMKSGSSGPATLEGTVKAPDPKQQETLLIRRTSEP